MLLIKEHGKRNLGASLMSCLSTNVRFILVHNHHRVGNHMCASSRGGACPLRMPTTLSSGSFTELLLGHVIFKTGGMFALYSLLCRHAKVITILNQHRTDEELATYSRNTIHKQSFAAKTKRWLEADAFKKNALLLLVLLGTCMVIGDGILTPAISDVVVLVSVIILLGLFSLQHHGPDKVGWLFALVVLLWFLLIGGIGILNICKHDKGVLRAFSPIYIFHYFRQRGINGWTSLGGIMLSITGTEALFADLAHFPVSAIKLMRNNEHVYDAFYCSIPESYDPYKSQPQIKDFPPLKNIYL